MKSQLKHICLFAAGMVFANWVYASDTVSNTSTIAAPGNLVSVNATAIQTQNSMMTMAINPGSHDVYVSTMAGRLQSDFYSTVLIMRPDNTNGLLTQIGMVYKIQGLQWVTQIQVDPAGKYVYFYGRTGGGSGAGISVYEVESDGMLFYKNTVPTAVGNTFNCCFQTMTGIALTPDGRYIYSYYPVSSSDGSTSEAVTVYGVDQYARITPLDSVSLPYFKKGGSPSVLHTLVASNHHMYVQHMDGSGISTYRNNKGKLTLVSNGANVNTNNRASAMTLKPSGKMLYSAALVDNKIEIYVHRIAKNGALEIVNIVDGINGGGTPFDMVVDSSWRYLYLLQSDGIAMYRIGIPDSVLIPIGMQSTYKNRNAGSESPGFFAMGTSNKFLYTLGLTEQPALDTYQITQPSPATEERLMIGRTASGTNWKSIGDPNGLTNNCNLSQACDLQFNGNVQSTKVHLIADDAKKSELFFTVSTSINNAGFDVLNISDCSVSGDLNDSVCSNIDINPATPWIVNIPAP